MKLWSILFFSTVIDLVFFISSGDAVPITLIDERNVSKSNDQMTWDDFPALSQLRLIPISGGDSDDFSMKSEGRQNRQKREISRLRYKDCGKPNRAIQFEQLSVRPIPIQIPGIMDLMIKANITRKLPPLVDVKLVLKKKYFGTEWLRMPCFKDYGSCRYKKLKTCTLTQDVFGCPVRSGYHNIDQKFLIPDPGNELYSQMLEGEYKAIVRARHASSRKELACLVAHFSIKNKSYRSRPDYD